MSQFLLLIFEDERGYAEGGASVQGEVHAEHEQFARKHGASLRGGNALQPVATGRIVRGTEVTDGPFAETKEGLGGYYLVEADDLEHAIRIGQDVPHRFGYIEVRPVRTFG